MKHSAKKSKKVVHGLTGRLRRVAAPQRSILSKIQTLPPEKVAEVEDFIDFLRQRQDERALTQAATRLAEGAFEKVWDNPDDAAYDQL
jgi:Protein of unknown function (DUF2281)